MWFFLWKCDVFKVFLYFFQQCTKEQIPASLLPSFLPNVLKIRNTLKQEKHANLCFVLLFYSESSKQGNKNQQYFSPLGAAAHLLFHFDPRLCQTPSNLCFLGLWLPQKKQPRLKSGCYGNGCGFEYPWCVVKVYLYVYLFCMRLSERAAGRGPEDWLCV